VARAARDVVALAGFSSLIGIGAVLAAFGLLATTMVNVTRHRSREFAVLRTLGFTDAGSLAPGRRADLVILDRDPLETDWYRAPPKVVATLVGGVPVFDAEGLFS
ncbi:MAG: amidohydrolase family protein, partial [Phycisphaerales bacterium]